MFKVYIGYDPKEAVAFHTLAHSLIQRATGPISITPIALSHLRGFYQRERGPLESTDFSITRFLVPYLSDYRGYSLYMDCDMICRADITQLWSWLPIPRKAVSVCQHDYTPKTEIKMDGQRQTAYARKNWSSFMVFDNSLCRRLTPEYVQIASGKDLHQFSWLDDWEVGSLPLEWNWLVGESPINPDAKVLHYTLGGPWFPNYRNCDEADVWLEEYRAMTGRDYWLKQVWEIPKRADT